MAKSWYQVIHDILGWVLIANWSFCNVPQFILNYKRKSVSGYSICFQLLNQIGFLFYTTYAVLGYSYQHKHQEIAPTIAYHDIIWSSITTIVVYAIGIQCWIYRDTIDAQIHPSYQVLILVLITLAVYNTILALFGKMEWFSDTAYSWGHYLGYAKAFISLVKGLPQLLLNFKTKSTRGFSIIQVLMDLFGGLSSFLMAFLLAYIKPNDDGTPNFQHIYGNGPQFVLNVVSICFASFFTFQHYVLFWDNNQRLLREEAMLRDGPLEQGLFQDDGDLSESPSILPTSASLQNDNIQKTSFQLLSIQDTE